MKLLPFSRKQLKVISQANARINVLDGPVRSGKTFASIVRWIEYIKSAPDGDLLMSGKTKHTIRRNVLEDMFKILGSDNYSFNSTDGIIDTCGRRIYVVGANDDRAEEKIRGMTIAGWYDDETTLKPESFFKQALARMSVEGAKAFLTTNPDSPYHWFYTEYLMNPELKGILRRFKFSFDDNLALSREFKDSLKKLYTGMWYKRMVLGLWVMAEGVIYDMFNEEIHAVPTMDRPYDRYYVSCDYGTNNPMAFGLWGRSAGVWYKVRNYHYDGRAKGRQKTDEEYYHDLVDFIDGAPIRRIIIDPSASSFIATIRKKGKYQVLKADNDVLEGIRNVGTALNMGVIKYNDCCSETFKEYSSYSWDEKAAKKGEDKPIKKNDHQLDSDRYFVNTVLFPKKKAGTWGTEVS